MGAWLKYYHPYSWYAGVLRSEHGANHAADRREHVADAARAGCNIFIPHVNGYANYAHVKGCDVLAMPVDWRKENADVDFIWEGLINLEGIGMTTALAIQEERENNGPFVEPVGRKEDAGYDDSKSLRKRMPQRVVNTRAYDTLMRYGAIGQNVAGLENTILEYIDMLRRKAS